MNAIQRLVDRVLNDETVTPFDYEPASLDQIEADTQLVPDEGDAESAVKP